MTYIDMVNNILVRLRERSVETVNETTYSSLIGLIINDAIDQVESAWQWSSLRKTITINTVDSTSTYSLTGSRNNITVIDVINQTEELFMRYISDTELNRKELYGSDKDLPYYYSFAGVDANGDSITELFPTPDGVYNIDFNLFIRSPLLLNDADNVLTPSQPILLLAFALAVEERGEDGAQSAVSAFQAAQRSLTDALALDAVKHPEDIDWVTV